MAASNNSGFWETYSKKVFVMDPLCSTMSNYEAYLRSSLSKYSYPDLAKNDILNAFRAYSDLRPKLDTFVFNDGKGKELLCLDGTIPVTYKGNTYNIPVCMWLMDSHPYNPPMAYVKPTATMTIKPGPHVDTSGRVYLPYLHDWRHPQSDLLGLIQIMVIVFGENPPVFAKSHPPPRPAQPPGAAHTPYPAAGGASMPTPVYPGQQPQQTPGRYPMQTQAAGGTSGYPLAGTQSFPAQSASFNPSNPPAYNTPYTGQSATQYPTTAATTANFLSDDQIKSSLQSAIEDKMKMKLREIFSQHQAEMETLKKTQDDLSKGKTEVEDMLMKLNEEQEQLEKNITILQEKGTEIKDTVEKMENKEDLSIDDAVVPTTPLYKQLLNTFAEEQATEDALYYLGEALRKRVIDLDVFLKQARELSRRQFMLRALIHKCRETAGLPEL